MLDIRNILKSYGKFFTHDTMRHIALNWSETEQCARHPHGPIGWIIRDQGQLHLYAGKTQSIMSMEGDYVNIATNYAVYGERVSFVSKGISNFRILGRHINKKLHEGQKILAIKPSVDISTLSVIGPETRVIVAGVVGEIINPVPIERVFDITSIFEEDPNDKKLLPADAEIYRMLADIIGVKK